MRQSPWVRYGWAVFTEDKLRRVKRRQRYGATICAVVWIAGCHTDDAPAPRDATLTFPDAFTSDQFDGAVTVCATDEDCPKAPDCCLRVACVDARCEYDVLNECCTTLGPCAARSSYHSGVCNAVCQQGGCESLLRLPERECGDTIATLLPNEVAPSVTVDRRGMGEGLGWHYDLGVPYALGPTWRLADALCDVLHNGPLSQACEPLEQDAEVFYAYLTFGPVALPAGRALVVEAVISGGAPRGTPDPGSPEIALEALFSNGAAAIIWRSGDDAGASTPIIETGDSWRAVAADLSVYGGQEIRLRVAVSATAGPRRRDPSVRLGALSVRAPCASERLASAPAACETTQAVPVQGTDDILYSNLISDPAGSCIACEAAANCPADQPCLTYECRAGYCTTSETASACCDSAPPMAWLTSLNHWTSAGVPWIAAQAPDGSGEAVFHFPLAAQPGIPRGSTTSPSFFLPPGAATVAFDLWLETEWDDAGTTQSSAAVDVLRVDLLSPREADMLTTPLWNSALIGGSTRGAWRRVEVPIHGAPGSAGLLAFSFDAGDPDFNEYGGVWIRRIAIGAKCGAPSSGL